ncbi:signal peptide peptidase SppA [Thermodesulfobacterium sp. TA1]|uniref:signal peptide peptidase SppA n=1 Tax=Thermodesulfobacterium sp. TA1 TaxID=2234087 RepID=UPI001232B8C9|nr:signal peptide peptidase SppA [Thermodesulfobacterium sp. TA1]QER41200.1 signal peptide peptidase SppA [Thermodesulfobacterium sp. TA1]
MKRPWLVYGLSFIGGLVVFLIVLSFVLSFLLKFKELDFGRPQIGVLEIKGVIADPEEYLRAIKVFQERENIKGVVVRIDSPGGSVGASQEIFEELKKLRKFKPVVISMGNIAASGGFYISLGGNQTFALPGTLTGSIGVVLQVPNLEKLLKKLGVEAEVVKSGEYKDTGSFYRPLSPKEREYLQEKIKVIHSQFVKAIAEEKKLPETKVREIADGRIFTGEEALKLGLIDRLGGFWDAVDEVKKLAKIKEVKLVYFPEKKRSFWQFLLEEKASLLAEMVYFKPWFFPNY